MFALLMRPDSRFYCLRITSIKVVLALVVKVMIWEEKYADT